MSYWSLIAAVLITTVVCILAQNFVTPEKRLERRIKHRATVREDQFLREMSLLLGPPLTHGNRIEALQNGSEIFPAMFDAIASAQHTVCFETFIYWEGKVGNELAQRLIERAHAGCAVHVIVDWVGGLRMESEVSERMLAAGIQLKFYRPLHWYNLGRMNNRTHRKLLIIDGQLAFTGGVGIADQWDGDASDPAHWRDMHFRVTGPVVAQMQAAFVDNWIKATGEVLQGPEYFPALDPVSHQAAQMFISSPAGGSESMHFMVLMAISGARSTFDLQAAYFVPDRLCRSALLAARRRGVRVRITVPGHHIDSSTVRMASRAYWGELLEAGIEIYEYTPTMFHNKMIVVDEFMVSVGSTNFDERSFRLNDEASLNIYDEAFGISMTRVFERDLAQCVPYTLQRWHQRKWWKRCAERLALLLRTQL
jgi:cardiolipin synthase